MAIAHGIRKQTVFKKQSALGVPASGAGGQILRRRTAIFQLAKDVYESDEIVSHQMSTGSKHGVRRTTGRVSGLLSAGTYSPFFAAILRKDFAAGATSGALTNVTAAATNPQFVRAAGSWLTDGFKVFDIIRWAGWATTGVPNNARNFLITALTATDMTGVFLDGTAAGAKAAGDSVTATVVNKKTFTPMTGHTDDLFTFEEWYPDLTKSEVFTDNKVSSLAMGLPATGNATIDLDFMGLNRTKYTAQQLTTPASETTSSILTAAQGIVRAGDLTVANVTGATFTINPNVTPDGPVVGSNASPDLSRGRVRVTGQFTAYFQDTVLSDYFDNETPMNLGIVMTDGPTATADFVSFFMSRVKLGGDAPDDGEKGIVRTFPFTAEIDVTGGAALANNSTILSIQDSQAA